MSDLKAQLIIGIILLEAVRDILENMLFCIELSVGLKVLNWTKHGLRCSDTKIVLKHCA